MPKLPSKEKSSAGPKKTKLQRFEVCNVHRSQIKNAPYNPRQIDKFARDGLAKILKKHGLVEPIVWNKRTGNLVGGHQRLSLVDDYEQSDDYTLDVSVIDVPERQEKSINIALNNPSIQGQYDPAKIAELVSSGEVDIEETGFSKLDLEMLAPSLDLTGLFETKTQASSESVSSAEEQAKKLQDLKDARKKTQAEASEKNDTEFCTILVFESRAQAMHFAELTDNDPDSKYIDGARLIAAISEKLALSITYATILSMKAISIRQPWAALIGDGHKDIEFRSWSTSHRGPLLICAGAAGSGVLSRGVALCVVDVVDCQPDGEGGYEWHLENPRWVKRVPIKGKQSFFEVPDSMIEYLPAFDAERFAMNWPKLVTSIAARF